MAQPFSQKKEYRDFTLDDISDMSQTECWELMKRIRWGSDGNITCPDEKCCSTEHYFINTRRQWRCKNCSRTFSVTSGTKFNSRKLPFRKILQLIYDFISSPQGCSANAYHAKRGISLKTAYLHFHKIRELLEETQDLTPLSGVVQIDGVHMCGKPRRPNKRKQSDSYVLHNKYRNRKDSIVPDSKTHPEPENMKKQEKKRVVISMTMQDNSGIKPKDTIRTIVSVVLCENAREVLPLILKHVQKGTHIMTDGGNAYSKLELKGYWHDAVNHSIEYMKADGTNNNQAESYNSRLRRAEFGVYNGMRHQYLHLYATEFAWRSNFKKKTLKEKFDHILNHAMKLRSHSMFKNYGRENLDRNEILYA